CKTWFPNRADPAPLALKVVNTWNLSRQAVWKSGAGMAASGLLAVLIMSNELTPFYKAAWCLVFYFSACLAVWTALPLLLAGLNLLGILGLPNLISQKVVP